MALKHDCRRCDRYDYHDNRSEGEPPNNTCDKECVADKVHYCKLFKSYIDEDAIPYLQREWDCSYEKVHEDIYKVRGDIVRDEFGDPVNDESGMPKLDPNSLWYEDTHDWVLPEPRFEIVLRALMDRASYCPFYMTKY